MPHPAARINYVLSLHRLCTLALLLSFTAQLAFSCQEGSSEQALWQNIGEMEREWEGDADPDSYSLQLQPICNFAERPASQISAGAACSTWIRPLIRVCTPPPRM